MVVPLVASAPGLSPTPNLDPHDHGTLGSARSATHAPTLHHGSTITSTSGTAFETTSVSDAFACGIEMELTRLREENAGYKATSMAYSMHISSYI